MNPHTFFYIDVVDEKTKKVTNWAMEMGSPNGLSRAGLVDSTEYGVHLALLSLRFSSAWSAISDSEMEREPEIAAFATSSRWRPRPPGVRTMTS